MNKPVRISKTLIVKQCHYILQQCREMAQGSYEQEEKLKELVILHRETRMQLIDLFYKNRFIFRKVRELPEISMKQSTSIPVIVEWVCQMLIEVFPFVLVLIIPAYILELRKIEKRAEDRRLEMEQLALGYENLIKKVENVDKNELK